MLLTRVAVRAAIVCGALALTLPVAGASAAYPPTPPAPGPYLVVEPNPVGVGKTFEITVTPCTRGEIVPITFEGSTVNAMCTNPHAKARFTAPSKPGVYVATARIDNRTIRREVQVTSSGGGLPNTGSSGTPLLLSVATSIVLTGGLAYVVSRQRRTATA